MVERTKGDFDEFIGTVDDIKVEPSQLKEGGEQYHLTMKPENVEIQGKTGFMHEWIRIPPKATPVSVPEGSVLDRYITEIEYLFSECKRMEAHAEVFSKLVGQKFKWVKKKLGKSHAGHEAKDYWTPVQLIK